MALKQRGIRAEYLGSSQKDPTVQTKAERGLFDILFMTPEKACLIPTRYWNKPMHHLQLCFPLPYFECITINNIRWLVFCSKKW